MTSTHILSSNQQHELLRILEQRFVKHPERHATVDWSIVAERLLSQPHKLWSLAQMEQSGGEPDLVEQDLDTKECVFFDCSEQSPIGRRSLCYDQAAWEARKANRPQDNAIRMAETMGITLLSREQYQQLQELGKFDTKTSSWLATPAAVRTLGGALFGDRRYDTVFTYHNGAESYYAARGFRGWVRV